MGHCHRLRALPTPQPCSGPQAPPLLPCPTHLVWMTVPEPEKSRAHLGRRSPGLTVIVGGARRQDGGLKTEACPVRLVDM